MMSLRSVARSAPRTVARLSSATLRQTTARPSALLKSSRAPLRLSQTQTAAAAFSTTPLRWAPAGEVDEEMSSKLESEMEFEGQMKESEEVSSTVSDFLNNGPFKLVETSGQEDVVLTRQFGNEKITVTFSISDLANYEPDMFNNEDSALNDEELETPEGRRLAESEAEAEEGMEGGEDAVPCRLNVIVEKEGKGALNIEAVAQDGQIMVENFYYFNDSKLAHANSADLAHKAQDVYPGPPFGSLDEDLQVLMERYLEERGVNQALAIFVPEYMDQKEQTEYQAWLKNVKGFIDA